MITVDDVRAAKTYFVERLEAPGAGGIGVAVKRKRAFRGRWCSLVSTLPGAAGEAELKAFAAKLDRGMVLWFKETALMRRRLGVTEKARAQAVALGAVVTRFTDPDWNRYFARVSAELPSPADPGDKLKAITAAWAGGLSGRPVRMKHGDFKGIT